MKNSLCIYFLLLINFSIFGIDPIKLDAKKAYAFSNNSQQYLTAQLNTKFISNLNSSTIIMPIVPLDTEGIESSAALYLSDLDQYLIISDETPDNLPMLFLMDKYGRISHEYTLSDLEEIIDMESMTIDENEKIYVASSLSENSNGNIPEGRRLLMTLQKNGSELVFDQSIDLLTVITECAESNQQQAWADFILEAVDEGTLDLEAMFWYNDALFLGFKTPYLNNQSVILRIGQVENMLATEQLDGAQVSIWKQFTLRADENDEQEIITDMVLKDNTLFITSVPESRESGDFSGSLWQLDLSSDTPSQIAYYDDLKPEGIAVASDTGTLLICFDQGANQLSQTTLLKGIQ